MMQSRIISSGSLKLDLALHSNGFLPGEIIVLRGKEESGKTLLCLAMLAEAAHQGLFGAILDFDRSLEPVFAVRCGIDPHRTIFSQPKNILECMDIAEYLLDSKFLSLLVIDSVTTYTALEQENEIELNERSFSAFLPRIISLARKSGTILVFTERWNSYNQPVYHHLKNHLPRLALHLRAGVRLEIHSQEPQSRSESGVKVKIKILRDKYGISRLPVDLFLMYNTLDIKNSEIIDLGLAYSIIKNQDTAFFYQGQLLGKNRKEASIYLRRFPEVSNDIEQDIRNIYYAIRNGVITA